MTTLLAYHTAPELSLFPTLPVVSPVPPPLLLAPFVLLTPKLLPAPFVLGDGLTTGAVGRGLNFLGASTLVLTHCSVSSSMVISCLSTRLAIAAAHICRSLACPTFLTCRDGNLSVLKLYATSCGIKYRLKESQIMP